MNYIADSVQLSVFQASICQIHEVATVRQDFDFWRELPHATALDFERDLQRSAYGLRFRGSFGVL